MSRSFIASLTLRVSVSPDPDRSFRVNYERFHRQVPSGGHQEGRAKWIDRLMPRNSLLRRMEALFPRVHQLLRGRVSPWRCQRETESAARVKRALGSKKSMCGGAPTR